MKILVCRLCPSEHALPLTFNSVSDKFNSEQRGETYCNHSRMEWFGKGKEMRYLFGKEGSGLVASSRDVFVLATTPSEYVYER